MGELLLFIVVALTVAAIVFGVTVMVSGGDPGLTPVEPDGRSLALPSDRPLGEEDVVRTRFDTVLRGYRMAQVDQALQRAAYDIGYKGELISVLEAEVLALREGRTDDADVLRRAREAAAQASVVSETSPTDQPPAEGDEAASTTDFDPADFDPTDFDPAVSDRPDSDRPDSNQAAFDRPGSGSGNAGSGNAGSPGGGPGGGGPARSGGSSSAAASAAGPAGPAGPARASDAEPSAVGRPGPRGAQATDGERAERR